MDSGDAETRLQHKRNFLLFLENEPAYKTQVRSPAVVKPFARLIIGARVQATW